MIIESVTKILKKKIVKGLMFVFCFVVAISNVTVKADASSLVDPNSEWYNYVYQEVAATPTPSPSPTTDNSQNTGDTEDEEEVGWIEKAVCTIFEFVIGGLLDIVIDWTDCTLDSVVMGRVGRGPSSPNFFNFELADNNIFGYIGSTVYIVFRAIVQAMFAVMLFMELFRQAFKSSSAQSYAEFKDFLMNLCICFALLFLMPVILEFVMFVRDYFMKIIYCELMGASSTNIYEYCRNLYMEEKSIGNMILWFGSGGSTVWFVFIYWSVSAAFMVLFMLFPFVCLLSLKNRNLMKEWVSQVGGIIITPVIDVVLICIPILIGQLQVDGLGSYLRTLMQVTFMVLVIPTRGLVRTILGFSSSVAGESSGLASLGKVMALSKMMSRGAFAKGKGLKDRVKDKMDSQKEDNEKAKMHEELAGLDKEGTISDPNAGNYNGISGDERGFVGAANGLDGSEKDSSDIEGIKSDTDNIDGISDPDKEEGNIGDESISPPEGASDNIPETIENGEESDSISAPEGIPDGISETTENDTANNGQLGAGGAGRTQDKKEENKNNPGNALGAGAGIAAAASSYSHRSNGTNGTGDGKSARIANLENMDSLNKDINALKGNKDELNSANAALKAEKGENNQKFEEQKRALMNRNNALAAERVGLNLEADKNRIDEIDQEMANNRLAIQELDNQQKYEAAGYDSAIGANEQSIADVNSEMTAKQEQLAEAKNTERALSNGKPVSSGSEYNAQAKRNEILAKYANTKNFENPEFASALSNEQKAALYRQRAKETRKDIAKDVAKTGLTSAGKVIGTVGGAAMSAYAGTDAVMTGAMVGSAAGEKVGSAIGSAAGGAIEGVVAANNTQFAADTKTVVGNFISNKAKDIGEGLATGSVTGPPVQLLQNAAVGVQGVSKGVQAGIRGAGSYMNSKANEVRINNGQAPQYRADTQTAMQNVEMVGAVTSTVQSRVPVRTPSRRVENINTQLNAAWQSSNASSTGNRDISNVSNSNVSMHMSSGDSSRTVHSRNQFSASGTSNVGSFANVIQHMSDSGRLDDGQAAFLASGISNSVHKEQFMNILTLAASESQGKFSPDTFVNTAQTFGYGDMFNTDAEVKKQAIDILKAKGFTENECTMAFERIARNS